LTLITPGQGRQASASEGEGLFNFLVGLALREFYGTITIGVDGGKASHVRTQTRRMWEHKDLPE